MKEDVAIKPYLIEKLKQEQCLWSERLSDENPTMCIVDEGV